LENLIDIFIFSKQDTRRLIFFRFDEEHKQFEETQKLEYAKYKEAKL
jgi:hypothetical protein